MVCPFASSTVSPGRVSFKTSEISAKFCRLPGLSGGLALIIQLNSKTATKTGITYAGSPVFDLIHWPAQMRGALRIRIRRGKKGRKSCFEIKGQKLKSNGQ